MPPSPGPFRQADLGRRSPLAFHVEFDAAERAALAADLGIEAIRKLRFLGELHPEGTRDWRLEGHLGATVVQACIVTLAPVVTRIDENVTRRFVADASAPPPGSEIEMPEDTDTEPLGPAIDPAVVMAEALALALPDYPRAQGVETADILVTEPGVVPLTEAEVHPFAALAALRKDTSDDDDVDGGSAPGKA